MLSELSPQSGFLNPESSSQAEIFEKFKQAETKIAIQKDGELTQISCDILGEYYGIVVPPKDPSERRLIDVSDDGKYGYVYARNKGICDLVVNGAVDVAVVGTDRLLEDGAEGSVEVLASYEDVYAWPLVLATLETSGISSPKEIKRIATQYPRITQQFFESQGLDDIEIVPTVGSTELYPYLEYDGKPIDGVVDIYITGASMSAHNLVRWEPSLGDVYPVLIQGNEGQSA